MTQMELASYARRLAEAVASGKKAAFNDLCFDLEYEQLVRKQWPQEVFNFFVDALRDAAVCKLSGSRAFILTLYNDFDKLTSDQRDVLLLTFESESEQWQDEMLMHSVADLVARKYKPSPSLELFIRWGNSSLNQRYMARVGLEVLLMAGRLSPDGEARARSVLAKLS